MPLLSFTPHPAEAPLLSHCFPSFGAFAETPTPAPPSPCTPRPRKNPFVSSPTPSTFTSPRTHTRSPPGCQDATKAPPRVRLCRAKRVPGGEGAAGEGAAARVPSPGEGSSRDPPALPGPAPGQRRRLRAPRRAREVFFKLEFVIPARGRWVVRAAFPFLPLFVHVFLCSPPLTHRNEPGPLRTPSTPPGHLRRGELLFLLAPCITRSF